MKDKRKEKMKLRNKKTGEIVDYVPALERWNGPIREKRHYNSLAELSKEWEDYEEPKEYWYINCYGEVLHAFYNGNEWDERRKQIGDYFDTKEEAEKAVEKLRAWKRLKEAGFIINSWNGNLGGGDHYDCCGQVNITAEVGDEDKRDTVKSDLDLLFGGEE